VHLAVVILVDEVLRAEVAEEVLDDEARSTSPTVGIL
jgi:hypothetical protein